MNVLIDINVPLDVFLARESDSRTVVARDFEGSTYLPARVYDRTMETTTRADIIEAEGGIAVIREHIVSTPDTCGGKPRIAGSRIQVKHVAIMHERQGISPRDILDEYPHLTLAGIHAALAYYHDHREDIDAEIEADRVWFEEQQAKNPSRLREKLKASEADAQDDLLPSR